MDREGGKGREEIVIRAGLKFCARWRERRICGVKDATSSNEGMCRNGGVGGERTEEKRTYIVNCGGHGGGWERSGWVLIIALYNKRWRWTLHSHSFLTFGVPGGMSISGALAQQAQSRA